VQVQQTLENKQVTVEDKPWKGFCCKRCYFAKSDKKKCKCRCHGLNHQKGLHKALETKDKEA
jgi:hypothetical protein